jgi:Tfp pilus assembly protein PilW
MVLPSGTRKQGGFTLIEVIYYTTILSVFLIPIVSVLLASTQAVADHDAISKVQERNRATIFRLLREIRSAMGTTVSITGSGKVLSFAAPLAFNGVGLVPGPTITYRFEIASQESLNGQDDNNNGLVDEGQLARTNELTGETAVVAGGISLQDSLFQTDGSGVNVTLANMGMLADRKSSLKVSRSLTAHPRN